MNENNINNNVVKFLREEREKEKLVKDNYHIKVG